DAVLALPSTALSAIIMETKHLYENAFDIITHGLNLKKSNLLSDMELNEVVKDLHTHKPIDIDLFYNQWIKNLYGEIIDFSTKAQSNMSPEYIEELYKLKLANLNIVEAVKGIKHLQKNLLKYTSNRNKHIKEQYNDIRKGLAELLRNIHTIAMTDEEDIIILLLSKAKIHTERYDIITNGTLDKLIRNGLITNQMATSLMNDSDYAHNISKNLITMAEVLFIDINSDLKKLHDELTINEEDINSILEKKG
ncbi:MAG: Na/Pi cotransporter family protein, partial [Campylobacterota bacterium]|nr:Na/Pi cotransporter family protein [Campylobacterota bacterium]